MMMMMMMMIIIIVITIIIIIVREVSTWAVSLLRYSTAFVSWRKSELWATDRKTRKLHTIYGALHPKSDVGRLYIPREKRKERFNIH